MPVMAKPGNLNYFGEVLYEVMRRPPRYLDNPSQLAREMRGAGYESASQQNIDRLHEAPEGPPGAHVVLPGSRGRARL